MATRAIAHRRPAAGRVRGGADDQFLEDLAVSVRARLRTLDLSSAVQLGPDRTAELMVGSIPVEHPYDRQIGPFYDVAGVLKMLGIPSKQALADRARRLTVLQVKTSNGRSLFPSFQFGAKAVRPAVAEVLKSFRGLPVDGWAIASWFTTPAGSLGGATPAEWLSAADPDVEKARLLAREAAERWSAP